MPSEMHDLFKRDNSLRLPTTPQVEQHPQQSEIVRYFRSLNEWLECDVRDRRAEIQSMSVHLDQTHNKVIPLLNQIVQAMDLWREGVPPGAARSPSDDLWDVISSHPSTRVAPTISAVSLDKASSSTSSSPGGECPGFPSLRHLHPSHLSVNMGGLPVEPELDRTPAPSLTKTAMPSSDPTEVGNEELVMPEQNDMVRTQLRDLMKLFAEHRDEIARKHELTEERWTANQVRWEDKHAKDAATHNMLERILANQADMMGKFSAFKDEVLAELRKSSVSSADHAITQPPSFHLGPRAPSSLSSPVIVGHEQPPPLVVPISRPPSTSGRPPSPILIQPSPSAPEMTSPGPPSLVQPLCTRTPPGIPVPIIIPSSAPDMPLGLRAEGTLQSIHHHYTSSAPSSRSSSPVRVDQAFPVQPPVAIVGGGRPPVPYPHSSRASQRSYRTRSSTPRTRSSSPPRIPLPSNHPQPIRISVPISISPIARRRTPSFRTHISSRSPSPSPHIHIPAVRYGSPPPVHVFVQPPIPTMSPPMVMAIPTVVPSGSGKEQLPPHPEPITIIHRPPSRAHSTSPVRTSLPTNAPSIVPVIRGRSRSPPRTPSPRDPRPRSPYDPHRPRSPYDPRRPRSPYYSHRPRSPYYSHRPRAPYGPPGPRHGEYHGPPRSGGDPYEEEWRHRPRSLSPSQRGRYHDYEYRPRPGRHSPEYHEYHPRYRPPRSRSRDPQEGERPHSRDSREGRRPHRPRSSESREGNRHGARYRPRSRSPGYYEEDRHGRPRRPRRPSEYEEGDHHRPRSRDSRDSRGPYDDHGRPSTSRPSHPRSEPRVITVGRPTTTVHLPGEDEPEHGVVHISPPSEPEYEHPITPSPQSHPRYPHVAPPATESLRKTLVASPERRGTVPVLPSRTRSPIARSSPIGHATVPVPVDQNDAGLTDAEQERQNRFDELAGALDRTIIDVQDGEEKREENYRANEEERQRIFVENERRREIEVEERLEAMWKKVEDRLAALPSAVAMPAGSESTSTPPGGRSFEDNSIPDAFEPSPGPPDAPTPARHRVDGAASRHAADIREAILLGKEAAQAERERALELNEAARNRMQEEHKAHIRALEDELSAVRRELAEEKMARAAEEAGRHERKRAEMVAQTDLMRGQVGDLIGVLLDRRDVKAIRRHDSSDNGGKTRGGLTVIGPRFAYACLGICLYSVFLVAVWG